MAVTVFLSHKQQDAVTAGNVSARLKQRGLGTYLDVIDITMEKDGPDLGDYLRKKLGECSQLLVVVSAATKESWWVPWEIGVATEKDYRIATFLTEDVSTPSYLHKWPFLRTDAQLDVYAELSKLADSDLVAKARQPGFETFRAASSRTFHRTLKSRLGQ